VKLLLEEEVEPRLKENGFKVEYIESNGHISLFAVKEGESPSIFYSGHVDVVPWDDRWNTNAQEMITSTENNTEVVIGRGVSDMKGGIAAMLTALPELSKSKSKIMFGITGDEEIGGEDGTKVIVEKLNKESNLPDYVITADAAGMEIITRRRNVFNVYVKSPKKLVQTTGTKIKKKYTTEIKSALTSHAAYFDKEVDSHCVKLACVDVIENNLLPISLSGKFVKINVIPNELDLEYAVYDKQGTIIEYDEGLHSLLLIINKLMEMSFETEAHSDYGINSTANVIEEFDDYWRLSLDVRVMLSEEAKPLVEEVNRIAKDTKGNFTIDYLKSIGFIATPDDSPLVVSTTNLLKSLGYNDKSAERGGATDGRFFAQYGVQTIDIGAVGWNVHGPNETATIKSLRDLVEFFAKSSHVIYENHNTN